MTVKIEAARKAVALRSRLDGIDQALGATPPNGKMSVYLSYPARPERNEASVQKQVPLAEGEIAAFMEARRNRLTAERMMILAEAAELGLSIEDSPPVIDVQFQRATISEPTP